jgi:uncharacterized RDD family membrane protein YckC
MIRSNSSYVITPDAFSVHPALVGLPLARPARRLASMLLDLLIVSLLVKSGGATLLGLAAAWAAFRMAGRLTGSGTRPVGRMVRLSVRACGALILFVVATSVWGKGTGALKSLLRQRVQVATLSSAAGGDPVRMSALQAAATGNQLARLQETDDEGEARRLVGELAAGFRQAGVPEAQVGPTLRDLLQTEDEDRDEWLGGIVTSALQPAAAAAPARVLPADSLKHAYADAVEAGDTAAARALEPRVASALARDSLDELRGELRRSEGRREQLAGRVEKLEERSLLSSLLHFLDDLGIGFGWTGLYFTAFVALWNGQTPGKRLLGVRVVRLDGKPMTMWSSFERFGGYAAGLVTGLMGFAQVYWDRNRQMIHDKIVETVVVRTRADAPAQS